MSRGTRPQLFLEDLDSFPAPPTFIPPSPSTPSNPPPSKPPAQPLPPVPGPSRISDTDTLLFLNSTGQSRSRRSSKLSFRDVGENNRDSFASNRSSLLSVSLDPSSQRSSPVTPNSATQSPQRHSLVFAIRENLDSQEHLLDAPLLRGLQKAPLDDDNVLDDVPPIMPASVASVLSSSAGRNVPRLKSPRAAGRRRESIALSSVALPEDDNDSDVDLALPAVLPHPRKPLESPSVVDPRAPSPDITSIIAATPRPRLSSVSGKRTSDEDDFIDDYGQPRNSVYSTRSQNGEDFAFGFPQDHEMQSVAEESEISGLPWDEANDSEDSDLDLHTSLPQLMLHHGYLSPRSKLLTSSKPFPASSSSASLRSNASSASQLPRDSRDTPYRRVRHRDGKTLRGGIGLTTGLGWSDSEDEDAPSALTKRLSQLDLKNGGLSRSASRSSLRSTASGRRSSSFSTSTYGVPFSRSTSFSSAAGFSRSVSGLRRTQSEHDDSATDTDEFGMIQARPRRKSGPGGAPPTSWTGPRRSDPPAMPRYRSRPSSVLTDESAETTYTTDAGSSPLLRTKSRVLRVMAADKEKPLPHTPARLSQSVSSVPSSPRSQMRPLRLQTRSSLGSGGGADRSPVPVPSVRESTSTMSIHSTRTSASGSLLSPSSSGSGFAYARAPSPYRSMPTTPASESTPNSGLARPKPRTGTGMSYRNSSYGASGIGRGRKVVAL
ncbi:unnamed protein product [Mycena citricolor]|uniref:Uncharacterized protein n=1 Tax=Mycena citricolor TaxID=2018698 RepID=A0AAD2Q0R1_9AGAR|nr:unnamed protein product [Mycena citricolor]